MYTADRPLFLDKDGNVVEASDPNKLTKLVDAGGKLTAEQAKQYGLSGDPVPSDAADEPAEAKAKAPVDNKAKAAPANKAGQE